MGPPSPQLAVAATFLGAVLDRLRHYEGRTRRSFTGFLAWADAWATSRISARLARDAIAVHTPLRLDPAAADGIVVDHDGETTHRAYMTDAVEHRIVRRLAKADIDSRVRFRAMV